jgi:hypothetical protein
MNAATKLSAFGAVLAVSLAGGAGLGAALGPEPGVEPATHGTHAESATTPGGGLPGLAIADQGYRLSAERTVLPVGTSDFRFRIDGPDGVVRDFEEKHGKELHLIVVSRDLNRYAHLHPVRDGAGTWSVALADLAAGPYRIFADFQAVGGPSLTLGVDVSVPGDYPAHIRPDASVVSRVDGFAVALSGDITAAGESLVTLRATQAGAPAALEPYLGANGHLVAIREGDLAYLHVHPEDGEAHPGEVPFALHAPSAGRYRLFFDFQVGGVVRTADFTIDVADAGDDGHEPTDEAHGH